MASSHLKTEAGETPYDFSLISLAIGMFLIPLIGGGYYTEITSVAPGLASILRTAFFGNNIPAASHFILLLFFAIPLLLRTAKVHVFQQPVAIVIAPIGIFFAALFLSTFESRFGFYSRANFVNWMGYAIGFFAVLNVAGRRRGPVTLVAAFVAGATIEASLAIREWKLNSLIDPAWRASAGWPNPNALAGVLAIALILSLYLTLYFKGRNALLATLASTLISGGLFVTQSRGGLLAAIIGTTVSLVALAVIGKGSTSKRVQIFLPIATGLVFIAILVVSGHGRSGAVGSRLTGESHALEQSADFRKNLWKGALELVKVNPSGTGLDTFQFMSAKSGLTTLTELAHNTFLQLATEASPIAPLSLFVAVGGWLWSMCIGRRLDRESMLFRCALIGVIFAAGVDNTFESNMYFFGLGMAVFIMLGLGLQLAADGATPELHPRIVQGVALVTTPIVLLAMLYFSISQALKAEARYALNAGDSAAYSAALDSELSIVPGDPEGHYMKAFVASSVNSRIADLQAAATLAPIPKYLRALAYAEISNGDIQGGILNLHRALNDDPNNLLALDRLLKVYQAQGQQKEAQETAEKMIKVENSPYFTVRALSEIVPLQTVDARTYLADSVTNPQQKIALLAPALALYTQFAKTTVPFILGRTFGGVSAFPDLPPATLTKNIQDGRALAMQLRSLYGAVGDTAGVAELAKDDATFAEADAAVERALSSPK